MAVTLDSPYNSTIPDWQEQIDVTEATIYAVILYILAFLAIAGNVVVCLTILRVKYLNMAAGHLIISLAMADILTATCVISLHATTLLTRKWLLGDVVCQMVGYIKITTICTSLSSLMVISIDRYLCIKYSSKYAHTFRRKWVAALLVWGCACLFASFPLYGWGVYSKMPNKSICTVNWLHDISYTLILFTVYGFAPIGVMLFSYTGIALRVHQSRLKVQRSQNSACINSALSETGAEPARHGGISREEIRLAKTMAIVVAALTLSVTPYVLTELVSLGRGQALHARAEIYITSVLYINSTLNPWIYGGTNKRFRLAVNSLFQPCLTPCQNAATNVVVPSTETGYSVQ